MEKKISLKHVFESYKSWVCSNPNKVTDVETIVTWSSYFIAGKVNNSHLVSELVYSLSKLLSLYNDKLIRETYCNGVQYHSLRGEIKTWLTVLHYCEVFIELVVRRKWGTKGKWTVAMVIQLMKCLSALVLLYKYKEMPIQHPPIPALQRAKFIEEKKGNEKENGTFTLRTSGRVIRRVEGAPPIAFRDWEPVKYKDELNIDNKNILFAETIHIVKPLVHLLIMRTYGTQAWKQWLLPLSLDLISLKLYGKYRKELSYEQKIEISSRKLSLLMYLLRSPMYDNHTKSVIVRILNSMSKNTITGFISKPILQYLNHWQDLYFYMWAS